jgi:hypothetical protein
MSTITGYGLVDDAKTWRHTWEAVGNADVGAAVAAARFSDKSVQLAGTFGGATVVIQGSEDGTNWSTLHDMGGNALSFTAAGGPKQILENPRFIRPSSSGGTGTDVDVFMSAPAR